MEKGADGREEKDAFISVGDQAQAGAGGGKAEEDGIGEVAKVGGVTWGDWGIEISQSVNQSISEQVRMKVEVQPARRIPLDFGHGVRRVGD